MKGKRYKVAFSIVLFQCYFNQHIVFNSFKINTFSLITYPLTLSYRKQTPQQMKISPASATGFWNGLYFYGANFILMESTLFELYIVKVKKTWDKEISILYPLFYINNCNLKVHYAK